jgi:hypothetical protein
MAAEVGGYCLRTKYLLEPAVRSSPALIWIAEHKPEILERYRTVTPQILDVVNPNSKHVHHPLEERYQGFRFLLLNTESTLNYLGTAPETGWRSWVVPHHHCNTTGYLLPDERIETPVTVGYVGEPEHLHDTEEIRDVVSKLGLVWINANSQQLDAYQTIDIGVAWTRREQARDETRSNIKLANFAGHGVPSVVCDYESYRGVDQTLGGGASLICSDLKELLEGIAEVATNRDLRHSMSGKAKPALDLYSRREIGRQYLDIVRQVREEFDGV